MAFNLFKFKKKKSKEIKKVKKSEEIKEVKEPEKIEEVKKPKETSGSIFARFKKGLSKTRKILTTDIDELFSGGKKPDEDLLEHLEEILITSDIGVEISMDIMERLSKKAKKMSSAAEVKLLLKKELIAFFPEEKNTADTIEVQKPYVIMVVGVNGTGKTTTLGKLAAKYTAQGKKVLIAAADTFRAAAIEQVCIWAERADATVVKHKEGADPAAVAFDAVEASIARGVDILLIDTAGRLHTQKNLMEELKKIKRTVGKRLGGAPHEILMVLDATTGQNAISQAKLFHDAVGITGLVLTKLDGTAKGGIVVAIAKNMSLPLKYIGVGEGIKDLEYFKAEFFINALFD